MSERLQIPSELKRKVLVEAGHRCAIPTCRYPTTEIAHIIPWEQVKKHEYENLIALCPNCHARADRGEIDRNSLRIYKRILQRLTDRYDRFELVILNELRLGNPVIIAGNMLLLIKNLTDDNLVSINTKIQIGGISSSISISGFPVNVEVILTDRGRQFIDEWKKANEELHY